MKVRRLPSDYLEELGHRIRVVRTLMKMGQKDLAIHLQTARSQVSKIETGLSTPTLFHLLTLKKLADDDKGLSGNVSWAWLLEGEGEILEI